MALIKCPNCKREESDIFPTCNYCGASLVGAKPYSFLNALTSSFKKKPKQTLKPQDPETPITEDQVMQMFNDSISSMQNALDNGKIPTITPNKKLKDDDRLKHQLRIRELEAVMLASNYFIPEKIKPILNFLDKRYVPFQAMGPKEVMSKIFFDQALTIEDMPYRLFQMMINIASCRAHQLVQFKNWKELDVTKTKIKFTPNTGCENVWAFKDKLDGKKILIDDAPLFPLLTCYDCRSCHITVSYRAVFDHIEN